MLRYPHESIAILCSAIAYALFYVINTDFHCFKVKEFVNLNLIFFSYDSQTSQNRVKHDLKAI